MKTLLKRIALPCACFISSLSGFSQTNESFEPRGGEDVGGVIDHLEKRCWQFSNFSINAAGITALDGDGCIVSNKNGAGSSFYTPALNMWSGGTVSFKYAFDTVSSEARSINIYLANSNNEIVTLIDNIDVSGAVANTTYTYTKSLSGVIGIHKIHVTYQGGGSLPQLKFDDLRISASKRYGNGCNQPPTAVSDVIHGNSKKEASGYVLENDTDPNAEAIACYLITDSKDGKVSLAINGSFTFTPNPEFTGYYTSFTYQICDFGYTQLCSEIATVIISFPNMLPATIGDLQANSNNNTVTVKWNTSSEINTDRFEIERSLDGNKFEKAGEVKALGNSTLKHHYVYEDGVTEKMTRKNDLYYRLKQVDADGGTVYSKILLVRVFNTKTLQSVSVTPNPAVNDIKVHVQLNEPAYVVIRLRSMNGDELIRKAVKGYKGDNSFTLEKSEAVKKGVYMLEVIVNSNERMVVKLIKN